MSDPEDAYNRSKAAVNLRVRLAEQALYNAKREQNMFDVEHTVDAIEARLLQASAALGELSVAHNAIHLAFCRATELHDLATNAKDIAGKPGDHLRSMEVWTHSVLCSLGEANTQLRKHCAATKQAIDNDRRHG